MRTLETDILILGSGGAGLFAALHAKKARPDLDVTVAVKGLLGKCGCTRMVQGGYNVALAANDSVERHFMDTIVGGAWLPRARRGGGRSVSDPVGFALVLPEASVEAALAVYGPE